MGSGRRRPEELAAAAVVRHHFLGSRIVENDLPGRDSVHDLDVWLAGSSVPIALEITRCTDIDHVKTMASWEKFVGEGFAVEGSTRTWLLVVDTNDPPRFKTFARNVSQALLVAEQHGLDEIFDHQAWDTRYRARSVVARALAACRVQHAHSLLPPTDELTGMVLVSMATGFSSPPGYEPALQELENFLADDRTADIRAKLHNSARPERHAFVWVSMEGAPSSNWLLAGQAFRLPARPPVLPGEITDVWWTSGHRGWLWRSASQSWEEVRAWMAQ